MTKRYIPSGRRVLSRGQTQWAPTLTSHDPNPPIPLEDPVPPNGIAFLTGGYADVLKDTDLESEVAQVFSENAVVDVEVILSVYDPDLAAEAGEQETVYSFTVDTPDDGPVAVWMTEDFEVTSDPDEAYISLVFDPEPAESIITGVSSEEEELEKLEQYVSNMVHAEAPTLPAEDPINFSAEVSEADAVVELEGSELALLYDDAAPGEVEAVLVLHFDDESPSLEELPEASVAGVTTDPPVAEEEFPIGTVYEADLAEEIQLLEAELGGVIEDAPAPPDPAPILSDPIAAEPIEEAKLEEYGSFTVHAEAPVVTQEALIDTVVTDDTVHPDTDESVTVIHLEDGDTAVLTIELDDPVSMELAPTEISYLFEDAPLVTSVMRVWIGSGAVVGTGMRTFVKG